MLLRIELVDLARVRLGESRLLLRAGKYDGALYLCGYSVEFALKARICRRLRWIGYPETNREFEGKRDFKTHVLDNLLDFTGLADSIRQNNGADWAVVTKWSPEYRYRPIGSATQQDAEALVASANTLVRKLL